jgi:putative addiction module component (TIGR02574 family)
MATLKQIGLGCSPDSCIFGRSVGKMEVSVPTTGQADTCWCPHSLPGARLLRVNARVDHILNEALALAAEERSALVVALLESLETSADPKVSDAWREEIHRRRIALRAGATQPVPWSDARARLHSL